jgi:hypothetical protein
MDENTKTRLGLEGARIIHEIEDALDVAIAKHGQLISFLPQARKDAGLSAVFGQGLFDQASELLSDLTTARRRVITAHRSAEAAARFVGYTVASDPGEGKGSPSDAVVSPEMVVAQAPALRVVKTTEKAA